MKNLTLSLVAVLAMSSFAVAGGDIAPVEEPIVVESVVDNSAFYLGIGYGYFDETVDTSGYVNDIHWDDDLNTVLFQVGYQFNEYIAIEGRYWLGAGDLEGADGWSSSGDYSAWGIYAKPMYPIGAFGIYGLLGYSSTTLEPDDFASYLDTDGFSWGLGAQYAFTDNLSLFADYVMLGDSDELTDDATGFTYPNVDISIYTFNVGLTYKF